MSAQSKLGTTDRLRILLVDDDPDSIRLIAQQIRGHFGASADVYESLDSAAAEKILQVLHIDIVITDLDMMDVNGFHILKSVKEREPLTQVIVVTGHASPNAIRSALSMGADEYFIKPTDPNELLSSITHLVARLHRWEQSISDLARNSVQTIAG